MAMAKAKAKAEESFVEYLDNSLLPSNVVYEVLIRLPAKSLCRFRLVCKGWRSTISDRNFMASRWAHSTSCPNPMMLAAIPCDHVSDVTSPVVRFICFSYFTAPNPNVVDQNMVMHLSPPHLSAPAGDLNPMLTPPSKRLRLRSVGGLICLEFFDRTEVYNPSTGYRFVLPSNDNKPKQDNVFSLAFASKWTSLCYNPIGNDYKVLSSYTKFKSGYQSNRNWIFSRGSGSTATGWSWRRIQDCEFHTRMSRDELCINGVLYFTTYCESLCCLMKFYVNSERFVKATVNWESQPNCSTKVVEYFGGRIALVDYPYVLQNCVQHHHSHNNFACKGIIKLQVLDEADGAEKWTSMEVKLPSADMLPRYGQFSLAGSVHAGELLVFVWTVNCLDTVCFLYNAKRSVFTRTELRIPIPRSSSYPIVNPMIDLISVADHQDTLFTFS